MTEDRSIGSSVHRFIDPEQGISEANQPMNRSSDEPIGEKGTGQFEVNAGRFAVMS